MKKNIICPCCSSEKVVCWAGPEPHLFCTTCFHRRKSVFLKRGYYAKLSGRSKLLEKNLRQKNRERLKALRPYVRDGMRILEVGCAEGSLGEAVKRNAAVTYYGIEPSGDARVAKNKLDQVWGSVEEVPPAIRCDLVLAFHVLEHIRDSGKMLSEVYSLLSEKGIMVIEIPNMFGNTRVPWDYNKEHVHVFSAVSIARLLEKHGFTIIRMRTGCYESAIYNDSMRIVACRGTSVKTRTQDLVGRFRKLLGSRFIVYGAGGDFRGLVAPYVKASHVLAIIDGSKEKIGTRIMGKTIRGPETIAKYLNKKFLIATYRFQEEIVRLLYNKGVDKAHTVTLEDIFGNEDTIY